MTLNTSLTTSLISSWTIGLLTGSAVAPPPPAPFSPTDIANLQLWLDASDATSITLAGTEVTQWRDKSGNIRHANQATVAKQPTLSVAAKNGLDVIDFNGSTDIMNLDSQPITGTSARTIYGVVYADTLGIATGHESIIALSSSLVSGALWNATAEMAVHVESGAIKWNETLQSAYYVFSMQQAASSNVTSILAYRNGIAATLKSSVSRAVDTGVGPAQIGGTVSTTTQYFDGKIAELCVYSTDHDTATRQTMEQYLADKWAVTL